MTTTKIATCFYCGTRSALVLSTAVRHELACAACGAPLHEMKWLKAPRDTTPKRAPRRRDVMAGGLHVHVHDPRDETRKKRSRKRKSTVAQLRDWIDDFDLDFDLDFDDIFD